MPCGGNGIGQGPRIGPWVVLEQQGKDLGLLLGQSVKKGAMCLEVGGYTLKEQGRWLSLPKDEVRSVRCLVHGAGSAG